MDLLEIILPILFAVGYFIVAALKGNADKESGEDRPSEAPELSQREQEIQEEIRRKIQERSQRGPQAEAPPVQESSEDPYSYDPNVPEPSKRRRVQEQVRRVDESPPTEMDESDYDRRRPEEEPPPLAPVWQQQTSDIEKSMRKQQEEIDDMQRRAEELQKKAGMQTADLGARPGQRRSAYSKSARRFSPTGSFQEEVIQSLKDPRGFKKAILSYEILGAPIGLRQDDKMGPLWKQH